MKKSLLMAVLFLGTMLTASAQEKKVAFGVRAGLNLSNVNSKYTGALGEGESASEYEQDMNNRAGFHLGVVMDWNVARNFYIQPGLYFTTRGAKLEDGETYNGESYSYTEKWNANYLQIPILASYRIPLGEKVKLGIDVGPYLAVGLGGKVKWEDSYTYDGETETDKGDYKIFGTGSEGDPDTGEGYEERGGLKRFDAGLRFGLGVHISKFYVGVNYDLGLANLALSDNWGKDMKLRNRNLGISVGFTF